MKLTLNKAIDSTKQMGTDLKKVIKDKVDYCSGVPEFNIAVPCCKNHDDDYRRIGKFKADWRFITCIMNKASNYKKLYARSLTRVIGVTYYLGVSIFGWIPYFKAQKEYKIEEDKKDPYPS